MNTTVICLVVILLAGLVWVYEQHPEAIRDVIADIKNDPEGARAVLIKDEQELALQKRSELTVQKQLADQAMQMTELNQTITSLENQNKALEDKLNAPPVVKPSPTATSTQIALPSQPNWTWTTSDGKVYNNVVVTKIEPDCVTILHQDGGARIDISTLSSDIQAQLNYNPAMAATFLVEKQKESDAAKFAEEKHAQTTGR